MSIDTTKLDTLRENIARASESRADREQREAQEWMDTYGPKWTVSVDTGEYPEPVQDNGQDALRALDDHDGTTPSDTETGELARLMQASPNGNTFGGEANHVDGATDGRQVRVLTPEVQERRQLDAARSPNLECPFTGRPVGWVRVVRDGQVTIVTEEGDKRYDGTQETANRVNARKGGEAVQVAHRPMTSAERKAAHDQRERERKARENGEDLATIEAARAAWLAKRAKRNGEDSAAVVAEALAVSAQGFDTDNRS